MSRLVRLFQRDWRERYESEFLDVLEARPPGLADRIDIVRAALDAHLHPQVPRPDDIPQPAAEQAGDVLARRLGYGAVAGAGLWVVAWIVVWLGPVRYDGNGAYRDGMAAFPFLLGAVALIAGGLGGQLMHLPRGARLARLGAGIALPSILLWGIQPWLMGAGAAMVGGLAILAAGAHRSRAWPRWSIVSVATACVVVVAVMGYGLSTQVDRMGGGVLITIAAAVFVPAWLGLGASLLRPRTAQAIEPSRSDGGTTLGG
jgi:hypothetical protein